MRRIDHEDRADLVGDLPEGRPIEDPRVGGIAGDDHLRSFLERNLADVVEIDHLGVGVDSIGDEVVQDPREVDV